MAKTANAKISQGAYGATFCIMPETGLTCSDTRSVIQANAAIAGNTAPPMHLELQLFLP